MKRWVPDLERPRTITFLRWAIAVVLLAGLLAFVVRGANNPKDPYLAPPGEVSSLRVGSAGPGSAGVGAAGMRRQERSDDARSMPRALSHPLGMM